MTGKQDAPTDVASRNYDRVARVYEELSRLYSFGLIRRAKEYRACAILQPGDRVLYLGAGSGDDAVRAAARGAMVTAIDLSAAMIDRLRRPARGEGTVCEPPRGRRARARSGPRPTMPSAATISTMSSGRPTWSASSLTPSATCVPADAHGCRHGPSRGRVRPAGQGLLMIRARLLPAARARFCASALRLRGALGSASWPRCRGGSRLPPRRLWAGSPTEPSSCAGPAAGEGCMRTIRKAVERLSRSQVARVPRADLTADERLGGMPGDGGIFRSPIRPSVQEGLSHFGSADGYIAYSSKMGTVIALGDPVASPTNAVRLVDDFIAAAGAPCFAEITRPTARHPGKVRLSDRAYGRQHGAISPPMISPASARRPSATRRNGSRRMATGWSRPMIWRMQKRRPRAVEGMARAAHRQGARDGFPEPPFPKEPDPNQRRFCSSSIPKGRIEALLYFDRSFVPARPSAT